MNKQIFFSNSDYDIIMHSKFKPIPPVNSDVITKRNRGRPKKQVLDPIPLILEPEPEPIELEPTKRRRGRPIGSLKAKSLITCIIGHGC